MALAAVALLEGIVAFATAKEVLTMVELSVAAAATNSHVATIVERGGCCGDDQGSDCDDERSADDG